MGDWQGKGGNGGGLQSMKALVTHHGLWQALGYSRTPVVEGEL